MFRSPMDERFVNRHSTASMYYSARDTTPQGKAIKGSISKKNLFLKFFRGFNGKVVGSLKFGPFANFNLSGTRTHEKNY